MNIENLTFLGIILLGIISGIIMASIDSFISLVIMLVFISLIIVGIILIILGIITSNKLWKYGIATIISVFAFFVTVRITSTKFNNERKYEVEKIITEIEKFKSENGKVPENLKVINYENELGKLIYSAGKKNQFTLICLDCDRKYYKYESRTEKWQKFE